MELALFDRCMCFSQEGWCSTCVLFGHLLSIRLDIFTAFLALCGCLPFSCPFYRVQIPGICRKKIDLFLTQAIQPKARMGLPANAERNAT